MAKGWYKKWEVAGNTVRAYGGKVKTYRHNCPVSDFVQIVEKVYEFCRKEGTVSKLDVLNGMHKVKLSGGRRFNKDSHDYKVNMVFDILLSEGFVQQKGIKKYYKGRKGRNPYAYVLKVSKKDLDTWVHKSIK